jgi:hypothetical protein
MLLLPLELWLRHQSKLVVGTLPYGVSKFTNEEEKKCPIEKDYVNVDHD